MAYRGLSIGRFASILLITVASPAQQTVQTGGALVPFSEILQAKGYITPTDVIRALSDPDPNIRIVAAARLAELHDPQAVYLITNAISIEKDDDVKENYAAALFLTLNVPSGQTQLENFCRSADSSPKLLESAATHLAIRRKGGVCADRLIAEYSKSKESWEKLQWLNVLAEVSRDVTPATGDRLVAIGKEALSGSDATYRLAAIGLLETLNKPAGWQALQDALAAETDPTMKLRLGQALESHSKATSASRIQ
jgi:HEAT repeat protein